MIEPPGAGRAANNGAPSVSPDGETVAFQRAVAGPGGGGPPFIYVIPLGKILSMRPDGSQATRVPFDKAANGVVWVPAR